MLVATAGHIDHGKTALVRALTGVETDRLPQEKARGISIDLGFAYWRPKGGQTIGFVDVPGHERFVRNMIAGLAGVDFALIVVALDDGVMPQTVEHVQILDLLGLSRGIVALTKRDRVDAARVAGVEAQVAALLAPTGLADAPRIAVSAQTGEGIAKLASALRAAAAERPGDPGGAPRMAIDRAFTVTGAGTVAAGTLLAGRLEAGAQLVLGPAGIPVRLRGLQSGGQAVEAVQAGERCAANLAGIELGEVGRGCWLLDPALHAPTRRNVARVKVLADRELPLGHAANVHFHAGTASLPARVLVPRQQLIAPGEERLVTLVLEAPVCLVNGDRFVLRDASGRELVGGGRVVDPFAPPRRRREGPDDAVLAALESHDARAALAALLAIPGYALDSRWFELCFNLLPVEAEPLYAQAGARNLGKDRRALLSANSVAAMREDVLRRLAAFHSEHPEAGGMTAREMRGGLAYPLPADLCRALLRELADARDIEFAGPLLRLAGHSATFGPVETGMWHGLLAVLESAPPRSVTAAEAAAAIGESEGPVRTMLYRRRANGDLWAIDETRFMLREHVAMLAASAAAISARHPGGFTAGEFRDSTAIGRNHVIRLLEFFDRVGVTARKGAARVMRPGWEDVAGKAESWLPHG